MEWTFFFRKPDVWCGVVWCGGVHARTHRNLFRLIGSGANKRPKRSFFTTYNENNVPGKQRHS
eukprot:jgi/Psemu1/307090/fgenesh1_kg.302_\